MLTSPSNCGPQGGMLASPGLTLGLALATHMALRPPHPSSPDAAPAPPPHRRPPFIKANQRGAWSWKGIRRFPLLLGLRRCHRSWWPWDAAGRLAVPLPEAPQDAPPPAPCLSPTCSWLMLGPRSECRGRPADQGQGRDQNGVSWLLGPCHAQRREGDGRECPFSSPFLTSAGGIGHFQ